MCFGRVYWLMCVGVCVCCVRLVLFGANCSLYEFDLFFGFSSAEWHCFLHLKSPADVKYAYEATIAPAAAAAAALGGQRGGQLD